MGQNYPDITVWCDHGDEQVFVQRYRWVPNEGVWVPSITHSGGASYVRAEGLPEHADSVDDVSAIVTGTRINYNARCRCGYVVEMRREAAQFALNLIAKNGDEPVPMRGLELVHNQVVKIMRS